MLLHGDSNIGKTMIVVKFVRDNPNICNEFNEVEIRKTVQLQMPANPCDRKLYAQTDPQIASWFESFPLPKWRESPEFREFVVSFGQLLPLEKPLPLAPNESSKVTD